MKRDSFSVIATYIKILISYFINPSHVIRFDKGESILILDDQVEIPVATLKK